MREEGDEDVCGDCKTEGMSADHGFTVMLCRECNRWEAPRLFSKRKFSQTEPDCYSLRNRDGVLRRSRRLGLGQMQSSFWIY